MAAPAPAAAPPLVLDAHADTLDHVVRAVARSDFLPQAVRLMLTSPEHLHDPELLYRTRGVRGAGGTTLLMRAVARQDVARAAEILAACPTPATRAELLACVNDGWLNALHIACDDARDDARLDEEKALQMVELLLANGADPLAPCRNTTTWAVNHAIHFAAQWSVRLVQRLVRAGASIDGKPDGDRWTTPLYLAAGKGNAPVVRALLSLGAPATSSSLVHGVKHPEVVRALLAAGAPVNALAHHQLANDLSPLMAAAYECAFESVEVLLAAGASVDLRSVGRNPGSGLTALIFSIYGESFDSRVVEALFLAGADANEKENDGGFTALHLLAILKARKPWAASAARLLLQRGADARIVDQRFCNTPAQWVSKEEHGGELHQLLLEAAAA